MTTMIVSDSDFALDAIFVVTVEHLERIENTVEEQMVTVFDSYFEYCCLLDCVEGIGARGADYSRQWRNSHPKKNQILSSCCSRVGDSLPCECC